MGQAGEAMNISHQQKKMDTERSSRFRDRFNLPVPDDQLEGAALPEVRRRLARADKYMMQRRMDLGGFLPQRRRKAKPLPVPPLGLRRAAQGLRRGPRIVHHDGHRAHPEHPAEGQE
jgi:pyruvate dehydrogenase E1 component